MDKNRRSTLKERPSAAQRQKGVEDARRDTVKGQLWIAGVEGKRIKTPLAVE